MIEAYQKKLALAVISVLILQYLTTYFLPGFYIDEAAIGAHISGFVSDPLSPLAHGDRGVYHFFPVLGGGFITPTYLYPASLWAHLFGAGPLSLRLFATTMTAASCVILSRAFAKYTQSEGTLPLFLLASLTLPWHFIQGKVSWDPVVTPFYCAMFIAFFLTANGATASHQTRRWAIVGMSVSLLLCAYSYPPARVSSPLILLASYVYTLRHTDVTLRHLLPAIAICLGLSVCLVQFMLTPASLTRSAKLFVFSDADGVYAFLSNTLLMLDPSFLFVTGDKNLRHALGIMGMVGVFNLLPLSCALLPDRLKLRTKQPPRSLSFFLVGCIFVCLLSSALTKEGAPHSLRATSAWPFICVLICIGYQHLAIHYPTLCRWQTLLCLMCFAIMVWYFFAFYIPMSADAYFWEHKIHRICGMNIDNKALVIEYGAKHMGGLACQLSGAHP